MGQRARNHTQRHRRRIGRVVDCNRGLRGEIAQRRGGFLRLVDSFARKLREEIGRHVRVRLPADQIDARDERRAQIGRRIDDDAIRRGATPRPACGAGGRGRFGIAGRGLRQCVGRRDCTRGRRAGASGGWPPRQQQQAQPACPSDPWPRSSRRHRSVPRATAICPAPCGVRARPWVARRPGCADSRAIQVQALRLFDRTLVARGGKVPIDQSVIGVPQSVAARIAVIIARIAQCAARKRCRDHRRDQHDASDAMHRTSAGDRCASVGSHSESEFTVRTESRPRIIVFMPSSSCVPMQHPKTWDSPHFWKT